VIQSRGRTQSVTGATTSVAIEMVGAAGLAAGPVVLRSRCAVLVRPWDCRLAVHRKRKGERNERRDKGRQRKGKEWERPGERMRSVRSGEGERERRLDRRSRDALELARPGPPTHRARASGSCQSSRGECLVAGEGTPVAAAYCSPSRSPQRECCHSSSMIGSMVVQVACLLVLLACFSSVLPSVTGAHVGVLEAAADAGTPSASPACTFGGAMGRCQSTGTCTGTVYSGLCPGARTLQCCIQRGDAAAGVAATTRSSSATSGGTPRITQTTLHRLSEAEHRSKWSRFKQLHLKTYKSKAAEDQAYQIFRANRVRIIYLNDRFGQGRAMFSSTSPLAATEEKRYQVRLGARLSEDAKAGARFMQVEHQAGQEAGSESADLTPAHFKDIHWQTFLQLAQWAHQQSDTEGDAAIDAGSDESFVATEASVSGVQTCTTWDNEVGLCRPIQTGACRTGKDVSVVSSICPFGQRCCIGDRDDGFQPPAPQPVSPVQPPNPNGPVSPASTAKVTGNMIIDYRKYMQTPIVDQGQCGRSESDDRESLRAKSDGMLILHDLILSRIFRLQLLDPERHRYGRRCRRFTRPEAASRRSLT
jgi:hypothetical protein